MRCKIADLLVEVPDSGNMAQRCREYLTDSEQKPDIVIDKDRYKIENWSKLSEDDAIYMESGGSFYAKLLLHGGMMLHSSAVDYKGKAYLFSGPSGMGKSTHTRMWREVFGEEVRIFNDDKPALRLIDGIWYAYGTPWCGKDGININIKSPLAGICFLRQGKENKIRRLSRFEATSAVISQTLRRFAGENGLGLMLAAVEKLVEAVPVYELINKPEPEAALLAYNTMKESEE